MSKDQDWLNGLLSGYNAVQRAGAPVLPQRAKINLIGSAVASVVDNATNNSTDVTLNGGAGGGTTVTVGSFVQPAAGALVLGGVTLADPTVVAVGKGVTIAGGGFYNCEGLAGSVATLRNGTSAVNAAPGTNIPTNSVVQSGGLGAPQSGTAVPSQVLALTAAGNFSPLDVRSNVLNTDRAIAAGMNTGSVDATAALQSVFDLNAVGSPGAEVYIPAGTYKTCQPLAINDGVSGVGGTGTSRLRGAPHGATVIAPTATYPAIICGRIDTVASIIIDPSNGGSSGIYGWDIQGNYLNLSQYDIADFNGESSAFLLHMTFNPLAHGSPSPGAPQALVDCYGAEDGTGNGMFTVQRVNVGGVTKLQAAITLLVGGVPTNFITSLANTTAVDLTANMHNSIIVHWIRSTVGSQTYPANGAYAGGTYGAGSNILVVMLNGAAVTVLSTTGGTALYQGNFEEFYIGRGSSNLYPSLGSARLPGSLGILGWVNFLRGPGRTTPIAPFAWTPSNTTVSNDTQVFIRWDPQFRPGNAAFDGSIPGGLGKHRAAHSDFIIAQGCYTAGRSATYGGAISPVGSYIWLRLNNNGVPYTNSTNIHDITIDASLHGIPAKGFYLYAQLSTQLHNCSAISCGTGIHADGYTYDLNITGACSFNGAGGGHFTQANIVLDNGSQFVSIGDGSTSSGSGNWHLMACFTDVKIGNGFINGGRHGVVLLTGIVFKAHIGLSYTDEGTGGIDLGVIYCNSGQKTDITWDSGFIGLLSSPLCPAVFNVRTPCSISAHVPITCSGTSVNTPCFTFANTSMQSVESSLIFPTGQAVVVDPANPGRVWSRANAQKTFNLTFPAALPTNGQVSVSNIPNVDPEMIGPGSTIVFATLPGTPYTIDAVTATGFTLHTTFAGTTGVQSATITSLTIPNAGAYYDEYAFQGSPAADVTIIYPLFVSTPKWWSNQLTTVKNLIIGGPSGSTVTLANLKAQRIEPNAAATGFIAKTTPAP